MRIQDTRPVHLRASLAAVMARLQLQQPVPIALTGAEWRALSLVLTGEPTMLATTFGTYVQGLVDTDLRRRGIERVPLVAREEVAE